MIRSGTYARGITIDVTRDAETCNLIESKTADSAQPKYRSIVTRPFSLLVRAGSGHETISREVVYANFVGMYFFFFFFFFKYYLKGM